ncbi:MAG TPA: helix-turn-helix transcriptional regulator [Clostridia bacterium]|nr:helix-turn-helix transcriptional regulator [Clostridia bacterium]
MSQRLSIDQLNRLLSDSPDLKTALQQAADEIHNPSPRQLLNELLAASGKEISGLAKELSLSRSYVYQIFEGTRRPGREIVLKLAFLFSLSLEDTQHLLRVLRHGELYARIHRDAVLVFSIGHQLSLAQADDLLRSEGHAPLNQSDE